MNLIFVLTSLQTQQPCYLLPCCSIKCKQKKLFWIKCESSVNIYMCVYIYIIPILIYLSIFLSIFKVSSKEIKLLLSYSSSMLTWCNWQPNYTNTGNLQCDNQWFSFGINFRIPVFSMEYFCIIITSSYMICLQIILENRLLDTSLLKRFN